MSMGRVVARAACAAPLCLALSGCAALGIRQPISASPAPPPVYVGPYQASQPTNREAKRVRHPTHENDSSARESATRGAMPPVSSSSPPAISVPSTVQPNAEPSVTLAGDVASKDRAMHLLGNADAQLARVDRNRLSAEGATTYGQANDLLKAGHKAATEHDYLAASGFAEKASLLASKLIPSP